MTVLAPPPAPPAQRPKAPHRRTKARSLVAVTVGALVLAALLNPDDLLKRAKQQPFGWQRDVAVRVAEINRDVSRTLWLDRPRRGLDRLFGHESVSGSTVGPLPGPTAGPSNGPGPTPTSPVSPSPTTSAPARTPTGADPLRVFLVGDSVMGAVSEAFDRVAATAKVVHATTEFRYSTGLSRPDYFDWPGRLRQIIQRTPRPEAIVVMFGANDVQPITTPSGPAKAGTATWLAEYRRRVASTMQMLSASGIPVFWVGQPLMRSDFFTKRIGELDAIYSAEAAHHSGITFIDTRPLLADSHDGYTAYLRDKNGDPVLVRTPDGVHLTAAGGKIVATAVMSALGQHWPLP
jgi:uncharacterized protein